MQPIVDIVDSVTSNMRRIVGMLVLAVIAIILIIVIGANVAAPVVAEELGERAERFGDRAMQTAVEEQRVEQLAEEGWGYSGATATGESESRASSSRDSNGEHVGGWGAE